METADLKYIPLWMGDFLGDTADLDADESWAYLAMIWYCFIDGYIVDDRARLLRLTRLYDPSKSEIIDRILNRYFYKTKQGWINRRALEERDKSIKKIEAARRNGKKGGRPPLGPIFSPKPPSDIDSGEGSGVAERLRLLWNNTGGLPESKRLPTDFRDVAGLAKTLRTYSEGELSEAIQTFGEFRERAIEAGDKVPLTFESFITKSVDNWIDRAAVTGRYTEKESDVEGYLRRKAEREQA